MKKISLYVRYYWNHYPVITIGLAAINILAFLLIDLTVGTEDLDAMIRYGAAYYPLIAEQGEYYRLFTSCFLHFGVEHLVSNLIGLCALGYRLEAVLGHVRYLLIYLVTGVGANILSLLWDGYTMDWYVSAGASGAVYGIVGTLLAALLLGKGRVDGVGWQQMAVAVVFMVFSSSQDMSVDHIAHMGGLLLGFVLVFLILFINGFLLKKRRE